METTLLIVAVSTVNILCFVIGVKVGQKSAKGEDVELPSIQPLNPINAYREHKEKEEAKKEMDKLDAILGNLDRYDGTGNGQRDIE